MSMTTQAVAERLTRAVDTLRSLPPEVDAQALADSTRWPPLLLEARTQYLLQQAGPRVQPSEQDVRALHEVACWLAVLDEHTALLVWLRAEGHRWRTITERCRCLRHKAWHRWNAGLVRMAQQARHEARLAASYARQQDAADDGRQP